MPPKLSLVQRTARRKRLIVLCDGTWQDSTNDDPNSYPTNVTRLARALARSGRVYDSETGQIKLGDDGEPVTEDQIVFYQKGVGTGLLDSLIGGAGGIGVSANVRSAYSFLANNYEEGDSIFVFGFSRGAYTARSVAAMVARYGLLTPLGLDKFPAFYNAYYKFYANRGVPDVEKEKAAIRPLLREPVRLRQSASNAVKIIGLWDTVGAITPWLSIITSFFGGEAEKDESINQDLPERVTWAFQALALDEARRLYQPMLWHMPRHTDGDKHSTPNPGLNDATNDSPTQEMKQVWFTGEHSDIGGGNKDSHLSDITLGWMIAQCMKTKLLEFDDEYLVQLPDEQLDSFAIEAGMATPWNTILGPTKKDDTLFNRIKSFVLKIGRQNRVPLSKNFPDRPTNEFIHASIQDRILNPRAVATSPTQEGIKPVLYPSRNIAMSKKLDAWVVKDAKPGQATILKEAAVRKMEYKYKGRIRNADTEPITAASRHQTLVEEQAFADLPERAVINGRKPSKPCSSEVWRPSSYVPKEKLIQGRFGAS